jgi:hypothetical protein
MKGLVVIVAAATVLVGACRRETNHAPMKLGADVGGPSTIAR